MVNEKNANFQTGSKLVLHLSCARRHDARQPENKGGRGKVLGEECLGGVSGDEPDLASPYNKALDIVTSN